MEWVLLGSRREAGASGVRCKRKGGRRPGEGGAGEEERRRGASVE